MGVTIVCAGQGEGKTTFLRGQVAQAAEGGRSVGGVASPVVFENDQRIGYDLLDLGNGERRSLARVSSSQQTEPEVGMFRFDEGAVAEGNAAIIAAVRDGVEVVAIDEVGPLEFRGRGWAAALETALRECRSGQELILTVRPALVEELSDRFASPLWATAKRISPPWPS